MPAHTGLVEPPHPIARDAALAWRVLRTKPRQEKAVVDLLDAAGHTHYLPLVRRVRHYGHRRRETRTPLFPSYVFVRSGLEAAYFAVSSRRVIQIVEVPDQARLDQELAQIRRALEIGAGLDPYPYLKEGRRARVRSGPFAGIEGVIESKGRDDRLILCVEALAQAVSLEIDAGVVDPIE